MEANPDHTFMACCHWGSIFWSRRKLTVHSKMRTTIQDIFLRHKNIHTTHINNDNTFFRERMLSTLKCRILTNCIGHNVKWSKSQVYLQWLSWFSRKKGKIIKTNSYSTLIPIISLSYIHQPSFPFCPWGYGQKEGSLRFLNMLWCA